MENTGMEPYTVTHRPGLQFILVTQGYMLTRNSHTGRNERKKKKKNVTCSSLD